MLSQLAHILFILCIIFVRSTACFEEVPRALKRSTHWLQAMKESIYPSWVSIKYGALEVWSLHPISRTFHSLVRPNEMVHEVFSYPIWLSEIQKEIRFWYEWESLVWMIHTFLFYSSFSYPLVSHTVQWHLSLSYRVVLRAYLPSHHRQTAI